MNDESRTRFWSLIFSIIQEFWAITEPEIEAAALKNNIPIELYYYSELGLHSFSIEEFQKRDPFSNPLVFEKAFAILNFKGWIEPLPDNTYLVTEQARQAAQAIIQAGDKRLTRFESGTDIDLERLAMLLNRLVIANRDAVEPPQKWAVEKRFRVAHQDSPALVRIREYLMDLFAYRDDSHYAASHLHFGRAGIVWSVLGALSKGEAQTADEMAETMSSRGYDVRDYEVAIQAAMQLGWVDEPDASGTFRITQKGRELREQAEHLTNEYFYAPWSVLAEAELDELYALLLKLRKQLHSYRKR